MKKLRWGVIGAGGIADRRTIPGIVSANNAELTAMMEVNEKLLHQLQTKWNVKNIYLKAEDLVNDPEVDAVYIASPVQFHIDQLMMAADAGKDILIEKPLALSSSKAEKALQYCEQKGVRVAAGFMMRFGTYIQKMKKLIEAKKVGNVVSLYGQFTCWYPDMENNWRQQKKTAGGGALVDMGVHLIDLMEYITQSKIIQVAALNNTLTFHYEVEDSSTLLLLFENGTHAIVQSNFNIPDDASKWRLEVFGDKGSLIGYDVVGQEDGGTLEGCFCDTAKGYEAQQNTVHAEPVMFEAEFGDLYQREITSFSNSILHQLPLEVPASQAVRVQKIIEASYKASENNCVVKI